MSLLDFDSLQPRNRKARPARITRIVPHDILEVRTSGSSNPFSLVLPTGPDSVETNLTTAVVATQTLHASEEEKEYDGNGSESHTTIEETRENNCNTVSKSDVAKEQQGPPTHYYYSVEGGVPSGSTAGDIEDIVLELLSKSPVDNASTFMNRYRSHMHHKNNVVTHVKNDDVPLLLEDEFKTTDSNGDNALHSKSSSSFLRQLSTLESYLSAQYRDTKDRPSCPTNPFSQTPKGKIKLVVHSDKHDFMVDRFSSSAFHDIELDEWEKYIDWDGGKIETKSFNHKTAKSVDMGSNPLTAGTIHIEERCSDVEDPVPLLSNSFNPLLNTLDFSEVVDWEGGVTKNGTTTLEKLVKGLILENGIVGRSIFCVTNAIPVNARPEPFSQSLIFERRMDRDLATKSTAGGTSLLGNSLQTDTLQLEQIIAERQKRRAQMAIDKTNRITDAMKTLGLGVGTGRTVTSSLMGPGGTERTGRPNRHGGPSSMTHDAEYVEQLPLVYNHVLVKPSFRRNDLRNYHRPKLPSQIFKAGEIIPWQLQVRVFLNSKLLGGDKVGNGNTKGYISNGFESAIVRSHPISITGQMHGTSEVRFRTEADLSPTEGSLVVLEYSEERPPIQLSKGMACRIVNYYRGDKSKCPISAGGGDRPTRRKKVADQNKEDKIEDATGAFGKSFRLLGPSEDDENLISQMVTKKVTSTEFNHLPGTKVKGKGSSTALLPEGVTEILHTNIHGPFIGEIEDGVTQTGLISNIFAAPMYSHEPRSTDFLMILGRKSANKSHTIESQKLGVLLRPMPTSVFAVGQTEPRVKVFHPNSLGEKSFMTNFISYQIAKVLQRAQVKENRGLTFDEISDKYFGHSEIPLNILRQRIKQVADYDKNTQIWTLKIPGSDEFPGVDLLGRRFSPESVAAYESTCAAVQRMIDLGLHDIFSGANSVPNVAAAIQYLSRMIHSAKERKSRMSKLKTRSKLKTKEAMLYESVLNNLEAQWKQIKRRGEVARFIYEEIQLAPWQLSTDFIDIHKNAQGPGMMKLTGLGDPSGRGEAFNFSRDYETKQHKIAGNADIALKAQIKKITGTDNDLRKLNMKEMAQILRSYGLTQNKIDELKRWDRVHLIRDLSTKNASDGHGDGLERYARGEKMKLSDQKRIYKERVQEIWRRQKFALTVNSDFIRGFNTSSFPSDSDVFGEAVLDRAITQHEGTDNDSNDDFDDDDDIAADLEEEFTDATEANQLLKNQMRAQGGSDLQTAAMGYMGSGSNDDLEKDAREYAALRRQRQDAPIRRQPKDEFTSQQTAGFSIHDSMTHTQPMSKKVIRRRITKTDSDGTQSVSFRFIVQLADVENIITAKGGQLINNDKCFEHDYSLGKKKKSTKNETSIGAHDTTKITRRYFFDDDDDLFGCGKIKPHSKRRGRRARIDFAEGTDNLVARSLHTKGQSKKKASIDGSDQHRKKKRKRDEDDDEDNEVFVSAYPRGTSNRKERGSLRDRMPHVILADRLERIRNHAEKRPLSGPFHRPVNRRILPGYYEQISDPIDLQTIRDKNKRYEYKTVDSFIADFELMKNNAVKFNGVGSTLGNEATAIYELVKSTIDSNRDEFDMMEEAVREQLKNVKKTARAGDVPSKHIDRTI